MIAENASAQAGVSGTHDRNEKIELIFAALPHSLLLAVVGMLVVASAFSRSDNHTAVAVWLVITLSTLLMRALLWNGWRRDKHRIEHTQYWRSRLAIGAFFGGAVWGSAAWLLFPDFDLSRQTLLALLICGASASGGITMASDRLIAYLFLIPCLVPTIVQFQLHLMHIGYGVGVLALVYSSIVVHGMHRIGRYIDDNIRLRLALEDRENHRRRYELELGDNQRKLQSLFDLSPLGCLLIRADEHILESNAALQHMLDYSADELKTIGGRALLSPHYQGQAKRRWQLAQERDGTATFEQQYIAKDGRLIDAVVHHLTFGRQHDQFYAWEIIEDITERKVLEKQMTANRMKLQAFIEHTPAAVVMLDRDFNCIACTARWARSMNIDPEFVAGRSIYDVYPRMGTRYREIHQRCLAGAVERGDEELFIGPSSEPIWLRWEVRPWYEHNDVIGGIMIFSEDITARKRIEMQLRERDALLQKITEQVPGVIFQFRSFPDASSIVTYVSDAIKKIFELDIDAVYADYFILTTRIVPEDIERVRSGMMESGRLLQPWKAEYRVQLPSRGLRWLHTEAVATPQPDGSILWHSYVADITELKNIEEQLQTLNHRFELAAHAARIGVWEWNIAEDTLVWDKRMYELHDLPENRPLRASEPVNARVHHDDWERISETFLAAVRDPSIDRYEIEYRLVWADNSEHLVRTAGLLQRNADGRAERATGVTWDITESKKIERMKSEFVSMVSHELRTPLTSIRGSLALLERGIGDLTAEAKELIDVAYKNSERLSLLINDILDIEKIESDKIHFDLNRYPLQTLIEQGIAANRGYAQNYEVELKLAESAAVDVIVDSNRFMQVLANLISNAVKFSPRHAAVEVATMVTQNAVRIEVRDLGSGIPPEFQARIFQRFSQADASDTRAKGGSGLGLSITKSIVEKMHGSIGFVGRENGGTVFFVELPRAP